MGFLDKLFGGKRPEPTVSSAPAAESPTPSGPVPARRERSKPGDVVPSPSDGTPADLTRADIGLTDTNAADTNSADAIELPPLPMDGENAALLAAINAVVSADNVISRRQLYAALVQSQLMLVTMGEDELGTGEVTLQEGQQLSLATIRDPNGNVYLPAFTDVERLVRTLPEKGAKYVRLPVTNICQMFLQGGGEGIVINPAMPPSGMITRAEAEILATGNIPEFDEDGQLRTQAQQQMRITIGKPAVAPAESFVEAIRTKAGELPQVREVHIFQAGIEDQPPRLMIGVLLDENLTPDEMHPSFEAIGKAAYEARSDTEAFDMMPLNDQMIEAVRPVEGRIYVRNS